jgi:outer membrane receptor protein involved in Fe transport
MFEPTLKTLVALSALMTFNPAARSQETDQASAGQNTPDEIIVVDRRLPVAETGQLAVSVDVQSQLAFRLDSMLSSVPGVGLFRRANSLTSHPTTQGLSMRGVGANGAGRVLVTLDGVPQNDPFGGWVYWSGYQGQSVHAATVRKGGSSGAFGAQALAGAVELETSSQNHVSGFYGSDNAFGLNGSATIDVGNGDVSVGGGYFETDGDYLIGKSDRGPVDARAASSSYSAYVSYAVDLGDATSLKTNVRAYGENRVNGFSLAVNETDALDASMRLLHAGDSANYELTVYYRDRDFANVFASARDERTTERAVLDQFDVPAWGAGFLARVQAGGFELGLDGRRMSGETNERFRNLGDGFTRQRRAGGDQWILGAYGEYSASGDWGALSVTARLDRWRTYGGQRIETNIEDGAIVREDDVPSRADWVASGRIGYEREITGAFTLRTAAFKSWRLPTLNEYYRPFRVVNDITEANPDLKPEALYGIETGFDYQPISTARASITVFRNWLNDGVGNVTIGFGPGSFPLGGFVPDGGVLRQRTNIDRSVTDGLELEGWLEFRDGFELMAQYLYARARITAFDAQPELVGNRPIQTPRHSASASLMQTLIGGWWRVEARYSGKQFDDDQNTRTLDGIFTLNAGAAVEVSKTVRLTANVENLFDVKVVSAVTADGLETLAQRRFIRVGLNVGF